MLERLEAKYLGLVFVAEVKRKEQEKADKLQKMQERAKAIEAQDRENRLEAKLKRQKRLRDMAAYAGWGRQPHRMEGSKAPRSVLASKGLQILAAPAMQSGRFACRRSSGRRPNPSMEQVVEDVEATPKDVRQFMKQALVKREPTCPSPEEDEGGRGYLGLGRRDRGRQPVTTRSRRRGGGRCRRSRRGPWIWTQVGRARGWEEGFRLICVILRRRRRVDTQDHTMDATEGTPAAGAGRPERMMRAVEYFRRNDLPEAWDGPIFRLDDADHEHDMFDAPEERLVSFMSSSKVMSRAGPSRRYSNMRSDAWNMYLTRLID